jgi:hypothetical protein
MLTKTDPEEAKRLLNQAQHSLDLLRTTGRYLLFTIAEPNRQLRASTWSVKRKRCNPWTSQQLTWDSS